MSTRRSSRISTRRSSRKSTRRSSRKSIKRKSQRGTLHKPDRNSVALLNRITRNVNTDIDDEDDKTYNKLVDIIDENNKTINLALNVIKDANSGKYRSSNEVKRITDDLLSTKTPAGLKLALIFTINTMYIIGYTWTGGLIEKSLLSPVSFPKIFTYTLLKTFLQIRNIIGGSVAITTSSVHASINFLRDHSSMFDKLMETYIGRIIYGTIHYIGRSGHITAKMINCGINPLCYISNETISYTMPN